MKKKPHQKKGVIKKVFSDFRERLHIPKTPQNGINYEVIAENDEFKVIIHNERGANRTIRFEDKKALNDYLKTL
ncbi:hypothetical protein [Costertonia aggregata]|uniref:Uncharacterized protein n=1 Tax=Costertonia aggregata TaxID=343403 RepID=A0A7H9ART5_9FLAO|nr:hypothetical protein [Costertonia aggregata]QLG45905.1 hypothetical protein HYG79_11280 [Costertonia aggregata]